MDYIAMVEKAREELLRGVKNGIRIEQSNIQTYRTRFI